MNDFENDTTGAVETPRSVVLRIGEVSVSYRTDSGVKQVLDRITLDVMANEFVCVVGPSGTGKTTLIRSICGLLTPNEGSLSLNGTDYDAPPDGLALVSQDYSRSLMPWLRIEDNVRLPLRGKGISRSEMETRVSEALEAVGLTRVRRSYPWQLSGGMQQRVSLARALAYRAEVLVMDEPFASVDAQTRAQLEDLVRRLQRQAGMTIVLVTHDVDESVYLADRVVVLGGSPASIDRIVDIELGDVRDQITTKSQPRFLEYRTEVFECIVSAQGRAA